MAPVDCLARFFMRRALSSSPPARLEWVRAMEAEFSLLQSGRLNWAFGCWLTVTRWNLRRDVVALVVVVLAAALVEELLVPAAWAVTPHALLLANAHLITLGSWCAAAAFLGALYPNHRAKLVAVYWLTATAISWARIHAFFGANFFDPNWTVLDAPQLVGNAALLGALYVGADIGSRVRLAAEIPALADASVGESHQ